MVGILRNSTYRHLFLAQVIALLGTGLATVALGLLAYELAGAEAGVVLGTSLAVPHRTRAETREPHREATTLALHSEHLDLGECGCLPCLGCLDRRRDDGA